MKGEKLALGIGLSQDETNKEAEDPASEEMGECLESEAYGEGEDSDEGESAVNV